MSNMPFDRGLVCVTRGRCPRVRTSDRFPPSSSRGPCLAEGSYGSIAKFAEGPVLCWFLDAGMTTQSTRSRGRRPKAPRHEIAGSGAPAVPRALWRFSRGVRLGEVGSKRPLYRFASQDGYG